MIEQSVARVVYQGDGRTTEFPFAFPVLDRKFIYVIISDRNGREKTLASDYYVDMDKHVVLYPGYPKGEEPAEAERPAVLAPGEKIVIYRNTPVSQLTSLGDKWPFDVCEKALDKLTMIDQENKESISRTVRLAGATEEVEVVLPPPEKDTAIGWSEDGKSVINVPVKRWQEEARAAAAEAQTQASMAMTYKEESKESCRKAEQSEEKAGEYAYRAGMAEAKVYEYAIAAKEKHDAFRKSAETAMNEINALNEEVKEGVILTGEAQQRLIKEKAYEAVETVRKQGENEAERVKEQGDSAVSRVEFEGDVQKSKVEAAAVGMVDAAQKAQSGAETAAREAEEAKNRALSHARESETHSQAALAAKEAAAGAKEEAVQARNDAKAAKESALNYQKQAESQVSFSKTNAQTAKNWAVSIASPDGISDTESPTGKTQSARTWAISAKTEAGKAKTEAKNAQAEVGKAKTEADRALTHSTRANEAKEQAETKAEEARTAADEAKAALKTAMGGVDLTEYAKKESLVGLASTEYVDGRIKHVVGTAPEALDTLGEIAAALTTNKDKIGTIITEISTKADKGTVENALMGKATKEELAEKADKDAVYTKTESDKRYLKQTDAESTYLKMTDAEMYCLSKEDAQNTYLSKTDAENTYMKKTGGTFLTTTEAANTYLTKIDAMEKYLAQTKAESTYVTKKDWDATFVKFLHPGGQLPAVSINFEDAYLIKFNCPLMDYYDKQETDRKYLTKGQEINLTGDVNGTGTFDGSKALEIVTTLAKESGVVDGNTSNPNAWWVKLGGKFPLIIQGGVVNMRGVVTLPISYTSFYIPIVSYFRKTAQNWTSEKSCPTIMSVSLAKISISCAEDASFNYITIGI